ncbi:hypothetical protein TBLA_0D04520 [Henningerozyma blattae CBS 6284]|uniref:Trafficking protein particle complex subunit n=1 Tax=Henningerozyma blattae (strain ATCC 34711 / CBS 6284 / DSM 70876 / NBRC 10599 / NRRL Y-10934 / UCD 77-7) TaxID=1071380 RepID=I2H3J6_HENB6|nr:hypothetical protein TBLA_0D04520 [Tetrapisispora blattae CBS 6284]CCH60948.1 hypothetical protein TBLA_0D04520 [Tetrapisispora blattae CBS 6284]
MSTYFVIIGHNDTPLYEVHLGSPIDIENSNTNTSSNGANLNNLSIASSGTTSGNLLNDPLNMSPFIAHAALDIVSDTEWGGGAAANSNTSQGFGALLLRGNASNNSNSNNSGGANGPDNLFLGCVDHFYGSQVTAYVTYQGARLITVHHTTPPDNAQLKSFYIGVHELFIKTLMNPFYKMDQAINSEVFDKKVKDLAQKYLLK